MKLAGVPPSKGLSSLKEPSKEVEKEEAPKGAGRQWATGVRNAAALGTQPGGPQSCPRKSLPFSLATLGTAFY